MGVHFILNFSKPYLNLRVERKQMITYRGLILMVCIIIWGGTQWELLAVLVMLGLDCNACFENKSV